MERFFDIGWSDVSQCQACQMEEGTAKHRLCHCPEWLSVRRGLPEAFRKWEQKAKTSKKESKWQRGIVEKLLCGSSWKLVERKKIRMKMWKSVKLQSWSLEVEGFRGNVAADGSLLGKTGKWGACGWAVVQLWDVVQWRQNLRFSAPPRGHS